MTITCEEPGCPCTDFQPRNSICRLRSTAVQSHASESAQNEAEIVDAREREPSIDTADFCQCDHKKDNHSIAETHNSMPRLNRFDSRNYSMSVRNLAFQRKDTIPNGTEEQKSEEIIDISQLKPMEDRTLLALHRMTVSAMPKTNRYEDKVFGKNLVGLEEEVLSQHFNGMKLLLRMNQMFSEMADLEDEFVRRSRGIINRELKELTSNPESMDKMGSVWSAYSGMLSDMEVNLNCKSAHANRLREEICEPLGKFYETSMNEHEQIAVHIQVHDHAIDLVHEDVEKMELKCMKLTQPFSANYKLSVKEKMANFGKSKKQRLRKVYEKCSMYEHLITNANQFLQAEEMIHLPAICNKLQDMEEKRMEQVLKVLRIYPKLIKGMALDLQNSADILSRRSDTIDIPVDIKSFCHQLLIECDRKKINKKAKTDTIKYAMPLTLREIRRQLEFQAPPIDLNTSISLIVNQQTKLRNEVDANIEVLKVPQIFSCLKRTIIELGGLSTEGIFRLCGDHAEIEKIYEQLSHGNYDIAVSSPIAAAGVLKKWLRCLQRPLFPRPLHQECETAVLLLESEDVEDRQEGQQRLLENVLGRLPYSERLTILGLIQLLRDISYEGNVEKTKMDAQNLSLVFGPIFMTNDDMDPHSMFDLMQKASTAVRCLINVLDTSEYPEEEEELTRSSLVAPKQNIENCIFAPKFIQDKS